MKERLLGWLRKYQIRNGRLCKRVGVRAPVSAVDDCTGACIALLRAGEPDLNGNAYTEESLRACLDKLSGVPVTDDDGNEIGTVRRGVFCNGTLMIEAEPNEGHEFRVDEQR